MFKSLRMNSNRTLTIATRRDAGSTSLAEQGVAFELGPDVRRLCRSSPRGRVSERGRRARWASAEGRPRASAQRTSAGSRRRRLGQRVRRDTCGARLLDGPPAMRSRAPVQLTGALPPKWKRGPSRRRRSKTLGFSQARRPACSLRAALVPLRQRPQRRASRRRGAPQQPSGPLRAFVSG